MATAVNIKAFLMQEQRDCSPFTLQTAPFSIWVRAPPGSSPETRDHSLLAWVQKAGGGGGGGGGIHRGHQIMVPALADH